MMDCLEPIVIAARQPVTGRHALLGRRIAAPNPTWEAELSTNAVPFLRDHVVNKAIVFPGAAYVETVLAAQREISPQSAGIVENLELRKFLTIGERASHILRTEITGKGRDVSIYSHSGDDGKWTLHATAALSGAPPRREKSPLDLGLVHGRCTERIDAKALYAEMTAHGLHYGPMFQAVRRLWRCRGEALAEIAMVRPDSDVEGCHLHPVLLDAAFQVLFATILEDASSTALHVPVRIGRIILHSCPGTRLWSHVRLTKRSPFLIEGDIVLCDDNGAVIAEILGLRCQPVPGRSRAQPADLKDSSREALAAGVPFAIHVGRPGLLASMKFQETERHPPRFGEVELEIQAVSVNFKDVLKIMGRLPAGVLEDTYFGEAIGMEAAATVVEVGPGVEDLKVGDRIVALPRLGCFRSHVTTSVRDMAWVPQRYEYEASDQAGMPVVFVTAVHALREVARLRPGERVLLHSATGGVGLAAIQVARRIGAEVFATAGSPEKRAYLHSLGIKHVMDSRSLDFADEIMEVTGGRGIDVLLNFLTGEALEKSLNILAPFGRMVEIGKYDIEENNRLPLRPFSRNLTFSAVDIDRLAALRPETFQRLLGEVWRDFQEGRFLPLPTNVMPIGEISEACRSMMKAKHIGKVILEIRRQGPEARCTASENRLLERSGLRICS
jgi:NADPH:quinone reductase-like Zn-dependent oxidoreductase